MEENNVKSTMSVKLLVNKKTGKIICAQAGKMFVDLISSFMSLQIGSVMQVFFDKVQGSKEVGSASNVYKSIDELPNNLMNGDKSVLFNQQVVSSFISTTLRINQGESIEDGQIFYICENNHFDFNFDGKDTTVHKMSKQSGEKCCCGCIMDRRVQFRQNKQAETVESSGAETVVSSGGSYVKEPVIFMITDDLKVTPTSVTETEELFKRLNIDNLMVEEHTVDVGPNEAMELLFASLTSTTALNDVFGAKVSTSVKRKRTTPLNDVSTSVKRRRSTRLNDVPTSVKKKENHSLS